MARARVASLLLVLAALPSPAVGWGEDINAGAGPRLVAETRAELLKILRAPEAGRAAAIEAYATGNADRQAEGWKRFRNPEFRALFLRLLKNPEWKTVHRALFALERYEGNDLLPAAWEFLSHSERRVREKAAITCLRKWSAEGAKRCSQGDWKGALESLLATEGDPHVRQALRALQARAKGALEAKRVHEEFVLKGADGLLVVPFLEGMDKAKDAAPGYAAKGVSNAGGGNTMGLPVETRFAAPLLAFGEEVVPGTSLQPFANPRGNGIVHTGLDVGACLDGAGTYAVASGYVKFVHAGSDMGTLLVLEHRVEEKRLACAVYMHNGDTVFVKAGDRVEAGQLLSSMGMSYSLENGGHYAHLHLGLYPGPFQATHNYGYKRLADGLQDWMDPAIWIRRWLDRSDPEPNESAESILERAELVRKAGWPTRAHALLATAAEALVVAYGGGKIAAARDAMAKDPAWQKAKSGEPAVAALEEATLKAGPKDLEGIKARWQALLEKYGDTDLAPRIREGMPK